MKADVWVVLASGPSLAWDEYADLQTVRAANVKTIAVNTTHKVAPWADVLYAGDYAWWRHHHKEIRSKADRWSCSKNTCKLFNTHWRDRKVKPGFNSGANAIELAANQFKAKAVIMLGFDGSLKHGIHHHGPHDKTQNPNPARAVKWQPQFEYLHTCCGDTRIINCSRYTELLMFERMPLEEALCELGCN